MAAIFPHRNADPLLIIERDGGQGFRRHFLIELDVLLEIGLDRAYQRLDFTRLAGLFFDMLDDRLEKIAASGEAFDARTRLAFLVAALAETSREQTCATRAEFSRRVDGGDRVVGGQEDRQMIRLLGQI